MQFSIPPSSGRCAGRGIFRTRLQTLPGLKVWVRTTEITHTSRLMLRMAKKRAKEVLTFIEYCQKMANFTLDSIAPSGRIQHTRCEKSLQLAMKTKYILFSAVLLFSCKSNPVQQNGMVPTPNFSYRLKLHSSTSRFKLTLSPWMRCLIPVVRAWYLIKTWRLDFHISILSVLPAE